MKRSEIINGHIIEIDSGVISISNKKIGEVTHDLKFGYHPAVKLVIPEKNINEWFELDTKNLVNKIFERIGEII